MSRETYRTGIGPDFLRRPVEYRGRLVRLSMVPLARIVLQRVTSAQALALDSLLDRPSGIPAEHYPLESLDTPIPAEVAIIASNSRRAHSTLLLLRAVIMGLSFGEMRRHGTSFFITNYWDPGVKSVARDRCVSLAAAVTARATMRRQWEYAWHRLHLSFNAFQVPWFVITDAKFRDHRPFTTSAMLIQMAQGIASSWAAIEELGIEFPRPEKKGSPSHWSHAKPKGRWHPVARAELVRSFERAGVDPESRIVWMVRGERRAVRTVSFGAPTGEPRPNNDGVYLRDRTVRLIDAYYHAKQLRNQAGGHGVRMPQKGGKKSRARPLITRLRVEDAANVQRLARRMILDSMGMGHCLVPGDHVPLAWAPEDYTAKMIAPQSHALTFPEEHYEILLRDRLERAERYAQIRGDSPSGEPPPSKPSSTHVVIRRG